MRGVKSVRIAVITAYFKSELREPEATRMVTVKRAHMVVDMRGLHAHAVSKVNLCSYLSFYFFG